MSENQTPQPGKSPGEGSPQRRFRRCQIALAVMNTQTGTISQRICGNPAIASNAPICGSCFVMLDQIMGQCPHNYTKGFAALAAATAREATS